MGFDHPGRLLVPSVGVVGDLDAPSRGNRILEYLEIAVRRGSESNLHGIGLGPKGYRQLGHRSGQRTHLGIRTIAVRQLSGGSTTGGHSGSQLDPVHA